MNQNQRDSNIYSSISSYNNNDDNDTSSFTSSRSIDDDLEGVEVSENELRKKWNDLLSISIPSPAISAMIMISVLSLTLMIVSVNNNDGLTSSSSSSSSSSVTSSSKPNGDSESDDISFTMSRVGYNTLPYFDYSNDDYKSYMKYSFLSKYKAIIEPYADMKLDVFNDDDSSVNSFHFGVCPTEGTGADCQHGIKNDADMTKSVSIKMSCEPFQTFSIDVTEYDSDDNAVRNTIGSAICMYVRREIRDLSSIDLSNTMDAMYTMWSVSEKDGQELYGDNYHDANYLLKFHHFNAAWQDADHIHEGNGFMLQHIKMTNTFEDSIQAVDPSVSLPYWDFTIESASDVNIFSSSIMTPDMFGSMPQPVDLDWGYTAADDKIEDARIPDGRWASIKADMNEDYEDLLAGYGYMRAPWNMNPSPYVSRFTSDWKIGTALPTCEQHYDILKDSDALMDFMVNMEDGPHATTHALTGGIYGCDLLKPLLDAGYINDEDSLKNICAKWVFYMKEFYRYNYLTPNKDCTVDEDDVTSSTCGFTCSDDNNEVLELNLKTKISSFIPSDITDEGMTAWKDFICTGDGSRIFSGDHLESASPADPSFWVIHPTLERLLHAKLMAGGFADEGWASDSENDFVCAKAQCYESDEGTRDYFDDCCYGHYKNDQLFDAEVGDRGSTTGPTNKETFAATDPRSDDYSMSYVYDKFEWSHCDSELGIDFDELLEEMYTDSTDTSTDSPTVKPTDKPTDKPTVEPTDKPTVEPTVELEEEDTVDVDVITSVPSPKPSKSPKPTKAPKTSKPTKAPKTSKPTKSSR